MKASALHHLLVAYVLVMLFAYTATIAGKPFISDENELIENVQALMLFISMTVFAVSVFRCDHSMRVITFAGGLFFLTLLLREVDLESFKLPLILIHTGSGHGRNILLLSLWLVTLAYLFEQSHRSMSILRQLYYSSAGRLYIIGGLFLLLGELIDATGHGVVLYEELSEIIGYYFMLAGAIDTPHTLKAIKNNISQ